MRPFDWVALLTRQRITFIDRGPNVKRGEVNIQCPWCGSADPSQHLGINLDTGWYSCWRNKSGHSGKSPLRLLMKLLRVGYHEARELAGLGEGYIDPEGFDAVAARLMGREIAGNAQTKVKREFLDFDHHFVPITDKPRTLRWWNYLYTRGFDHEDIARLCKEYGLMAARDGHYAMRLIIPYFIEGRLVTWTGRAIAPSSIRYKDLPIEFALTPVKETLYNRDAMNEGGRLLVLVEGPLDALKIDFYGAPYRIRAVALSTNSITDSQMFDLEIGAGKFDRVAAMLDNKTNYGIVDSMKLKQSLSFLPGIEVLPVPAGRGDPGELLPDEVREWAKQQ